MVLAGEGILHGPEDAESGAEHAPFKHRKLLLASTAPTVPLGQLQLPLAALPPLEQVAAQEMAAVSRVPGVSCNNNVNYVAQLSKPAADLR